MIPIPKLLKDRPRDERGFPIPYNVQIGTDGKPLFTVNDSERHVICLRRGLCPICGRRIIRDMWFVGGPKSAFDPYGAYIDLPGHKQCEEYALQVCPYLSAQRYVHRIDVVDPSKVPGLTLIDPTLDPDRPLLFVSVGAMRMKVIPRGAFDPLPIVRPIPPLIGITYWQSGKKLSDEEGIALVRETFGPEWNPPDT